MTKPAFWPPLAPPGTPPAEAMADAKARVRELLADVESWVGEAPDETADWHDVNDVHHLINWLGRTLNVTNYRGLARIMAKRAVAYANWAD